MSRSGSSGAFSGTTRHRLEPTYVANFAKPLLRRQGQNPRNIFEHVCVDDGKGKELGPKLEPGGFE